MAIYRASKEEVENYFNSDSISQSKLKLLLVSGEAFMNVKEPELFFEEKKHFLIGSAVDDWITMGEEYMDNNYYITQLENKPSSKVMSIIQQYYSFLHNREDEEISDELQQDYLFVAIQEHEYQSNWKRETRINKVLREGEEYFNMLLLSDGKTILSQEEYDTISNIVNKLTTHPYTENYFDIGDNKFAEIDVFYQLPIYFRFEIDKVSVKCKALLDMVHVDHSTKTIIPFDIKTIGDYTKHFDKQSKKRRYDIQASWYIKALEAWRDTHYKDYTILDFRFVVASTTQECEPLVFETNQFFIDAGEHGTYSITQGGTNNNFTKATYYKNDGWKALLHRYIWHLENGFDKDWENTFNQGHYILSGDYTKTGKYETTT